jgi:2-methylcitrate dehydratase PrpD
VDAPSLSHKLGHLVADTLMTDIPEATLERARVSLLHNLVVGLLGRGRPSVAHVMAKRFWGLPAEASLLRDGTQVSLEAAAFANAALMNARSQDDTHPGSTSHPGSPSMAAALAVAEVMQASGAEFLAAAVMGYEVLCRIGRDFDERITERGFRAAAVLGGFGAVGAAARLMRLSAQETAHAIGLVANLSGGLAQVWREGSAEAPLQLAFGARNGIAAARAAACGAGAASYALEGEAGFFRAFADTSAESVEALRGLGEQWQIDEVTVKPFPVCAILQGPVGTFLELLDTHDMNVDTVADIEVALSPYEAAYPGIDFPGPFASSIATKMSAQFSLALAAVDRRITLTGLDRVTDPAVLALSRRVRVVASPTIAPRHSKTSVRLRDGNVVSGVVDVPVGRPSYAEVARFARAMAPEIGTETAAVDRLAEAVAMLGNASNVQAVIAAAVACGGR